MSANQAFLAELENETVITRRVLQRMPDDHLTWKPHEKSMTLGQLAMHVANIPGTIAGLVSGDVFNVDPERFGNQPQPATRQEILDALEQSITTAKTYLSGLDDQSASATWRLLVSGNEVMAVPRAAAIRTIMLNHWYHHRGQLTVYFRLLDIPVPAVYGASADDNPFARAAGAEATS